MQEQLLQKYLTEIERADLPDPRQELLSTDFSNVSVIEAAVLLARLLLHEEPFSADAFEFPDDTPYNSRLRRLSEKGNENFRRLLTNWLLVNPHSSALYPIYLYNIGYGHARKVFDLLLRTEPKTPPPYLFRVIQHILLHYLGREKMAPLIARQNDIAMWSPILNDLFYDVQIVENWLKEKDETLRFYGGQTNTVLGYYDRVFQTTGVLNRLNKSADVYYDLGGGFNTPEIVRLSGGLPFRSLDIIPPEPPDNLILVKKTDRGEVLLSDSEYDDYVGRLRGTPYQKFNVFTDDFCSDYSSYAIVSTGFLTSTVRPVGVEGNFGGRGFYLTSLMAIARIMQLVRAGKSVDLLTVNRATTRVYTHGTVYLSFSKGRLDDIQTIPYGKKTRFRPERIEFILRCVHPDTSPFKSYVLLSAGSELGRPGEASTPTPLTP